MAQILKNSSNKYGLRKKFIAFIKDERLNLNVMISKLKSVVLIMFFLRHVSMAHHMKKCAKIWNMFLLGLHKYICKSASLGPKKLGREGRSGIKLMLKLIFI